MNAKEFKQQKAELAQRFGKQLAEGDKPKEYLKLVAPLAKYAKMDVTRITGSIVLDWMEANPDWKKAAPKAPVAPPVSEEYAVFCDDQRRTCIRVAVTKKGVEFIPMDSSLSVLHLSHMEFEKLYNKQLKDYPVKRAAELYASGTWMEVTAEARKHLEFLTGSKFKDAVPTLNFEDKEAIMATSKTASKPATKKPAAKAAPTKVAAPKAEKPAKVVKEPAGPDTRKITVLVEKGTNPKRGGAAERFALYQNKMTVEAYVEAGGKREDIAWDVKKGFISVA